MYARILVALDGAGPVADVSAQAISLAKVSGAQLIALHVLESPLALVLPPDIGVVVGSAMRESPPPDADPVLLELRERAAVEGIDILTFQARDASPANAILETVSEQHCDLVVMSSAGVSGLLAWLHGAPAMEVVKRSEVPVLLTH